MFHRVHLVLCALLAACAADGPTSAPDERFVLDVESVSFTDVADSLRVRGKIGLRNVTVLTLRVASEAREVGALPVLDAAALRRGVLLPGGPGSAQVEVLAFGRTDTLTATVTVAGPTIFSVRTTDHGGTDTTTFLGTGLDAIADGTLELAGAAVPFLGRGPTFVQVAAPSVATSCAAGSSLVAFAAPGVTVSPAARLYTPGGAEVDLAPGEWRELSAIEADCLRLPGGDREYLVAHVDAASVEAGRTQFHDPPFALFSTTVTDRSAGTLASSNVASRPAVASATAHARHGGTPWSLASSNHWMPGTCSDADFTSPFRLFWCRSKPWVVGDTMRIVRPYTGGADTVRASVYAIYGGRWVFARIDGDNSEALQQMQDTIQAVMPDVIATGLPVLRAAFGVADPTTSRASGQLLTLIGDFTHGSVAGGCCVDDGPWTAITLGSTLAGDRGQMFHLLTHEYAHAYQRRFLYDSLPAGGDALHSGITWGNEGGADLLAFEAVRRYANVPWAGNLDERALIVQPGRGTPLLDELGASGRLLAGYHEASAYLRDLVFRLEAAGVTRETAFATVARGAVEGWYGYEFTGGKRPGLVERVAARVGAAWDPSRSLLLYALAQAADERVESQELRNPFWLTAWRNFGGTHRNKEVVAGSGAAYASTDQLRMGVGAIRLRLPEGAGAFALSSDLPGIRWAIARTR